MSDDFMAQRRAEVIDMMIERNLATVEAETPPKFRGVEATDGQVIDWCRSLVPAIRTYESVSARSLLLLGPVGVGKTHQAYGALRYLAAAAFPNKPKVVTAVDMYASLRPRGGVDSEEVFSTYAHAGLLFVDDMGTEKGSEWVEQTNYRLINHRYNQVAPTIITSNVLPSQISSVLGDRTASRLIEMCDVVVLKGSDRRRQK